MSPFLIVAQVEAAAKTAETLADRIPYLAAVLFQALVIIGIGYLVFTRLIDKIDRIEERHQKALDDNREAMGKMMDRHAGAFEKVADQYQSVVSENSVMQGRVLQALDGFLAVVRSLRGEKSA